MLTERLCLFSRNLRYIGPSATVTLVLDAHSALDGSARHNSSSDFGATANLGWITSSLGVNLSKVLPSVESVTFPDRDLSDTLVRAYFDSIHPLFPVLDEREFNLRYAEMFNQALRNGESESAPKADPLFVASLFAVFACSSRIVQDPRVCPRGREAQLWGYENSAGVGEKGPLTGKKAGKENGSTSSTAADGPAATEAPKEEKANFALAGVQFYARSQLLALHKSMETRIEQVQTHALLACESLREKIAAFCADESPLWQITWRHLIALLAPGSSLAKLCEWLVTLACIAT